MDNFNNVQAQPFYNTIQLTDIEWATENEKASALMTIIRKVYEANPSTEISGWQMKDYLDFKLNKKHNILSVRRSISNLKKGDILKRTSLMRMGNEGKNEHFYVLSGGEKPVEKVMDGVSISDHAKKIIEHRTYSQPTLYDNINDNGEKVDN